MSKIIALFNQAGGVAKTTLTMNLGYHLSQISPPRKKQNTKAKAIAQIKDEATRKQLLNLAIANSLSLSQIRSLIKELKPVQQQSELKTRFDNTYKQVKKAKNLWSNAKKRQQLESLLTKLETHGSLKSKIVEKIKTIESSNSIGLSDGSQSGTSWGTR